VGLMAEQRLVMRGVPVLPAGITRGLASGPCVVLRAIRQAAVVARDIGRAGRERMLALRPPPTAAHRLNRDGIRIAPAACRRQPAPI
jgi:hypothetical protein